MSNFIPSSDKASPFHPGEKEVHAKLGITEIEDWARVVVRNAMPDQHREFFEGLPFLVIGARDGEGRPWATLLSEPGPFITSPDAKRLVVEAKPNIGDALESQLKPGDDVGILGISLEDRRRNRASTVVGETGKTGLTLDITQSFGNCPQYIHARHYWRDTDGNAPQSTRSQRLSPKQQDLIAKSDTFFIATGYRGEGDSEAWGMDASHRGGEPGFVKIIDDGRIMFPDYSGNNHFNTIGNLMRDPRAGLLFINFATGDMLQVSGTTTIDWTPDADQYGPEARRLVFLDIEDVNQLDHGTKLRWDSDGASVRSLKVVNKTRETQDVVSFELEARDKGALAPFSAGQHLPIELNIETAGTKAARQYSLSGSPNKSTYRISVKKEPQGLVSTYLHDHIEVGSELTTRSPAGDFTLPQDQRPISLLAAGIGVTPLLSMLHHLDETGDTRPVKFVHVVRDGDHHPFKDEVKTISGRNENITSFSVYTRPTQNDHHEKAFDSVGRLTIQDLVEMGLDPNAQAILCGPPGFIATTRQLLADLGMPDAQITEETF